MPQRINQVEMKRKGLDCSITTRPMKEEDIPRVMELRRNYKTHDVSSLILTWFTVDPKCIQVAENKAGEIVGTLSCVRQNCNFYFLGLLYVLDEYRGSGIGMQLWNLCMQNIGSDNAALNSPLNRMEIYRDGSGFTTVETEFRCVTNYTKGLVNPEVLSDHLPQGVTIEPFNKSHLPHIFEYDFALVGYERERVLELSCQERDSKTLVAFKNGICVGFGTIRTTCLGGGRVGPLYADDPSVAEVMLRNLIVSLPLVSCFVMMTVSTNVPARQFLQKLDCPKLNEMIRLYKADKLSVNTEKVFALFDLSFQPF